MDASAIGCEAKVLRRSLPDEALSIVARALPVNSTSRSLCRTGAMPPMTQAAPPMRFELRRPLATGPNEKRIHGLS